MADGLSLFGWGPVWPLTLSALRRDGTARKAQPIVMALPSGPHTDERKGLTLVQGRARLVILAGEVGGRWSPGALAVAKGRMVKHLLLSNSARFRWEETFLHPKTSCGTACFDSCSVRCVCDFVVH